MKIHILYLLLYMSHLARTNFILSVKEFDAAFTIETALGRMTGEIATKLFSDYVCVAIITETNTSYAGELFKYFPTDLVPIMHISFSLSEKFKQDTIQKQVNEEPTFNTYSFVQLILASLNERCIGYIIQVTDVSFMVGTFSELTRWASQRVNRNFLYLPIVSDNSVPTCDQWNEDIRNIFSLRSMDFMPDLVVVKVFPQVNTKLHREDIAFNTEFLDGENGEHNISSKYTSEEETIENIFCKTDYYENNTEVLENIDIFNTCDNKFGVCVDNETSQTHFMVLKKEKEEFVKNSQLEDFHEYKFKLITHKFKWPNPEQEVFLDIWSSNTGFLQKVNLYPNKIMNLMGKPLYITTLPYPPFAVLDIEVDPPVNDGVEFRIVYEYVKKHNMTYQGIYDLENLWGVIWPNGSGIGLTGLVAEDKADIGFGAVYLWDDEYKFTDYSHSYGYSGITVVAPKPVALPGIMIPLLPFTPEMWLAVCIYLIMTTLILYSLSTVTHKLLGQNIVNRYSTLLECAFRTLGLLVLQVPDDERDQNIPRHVPMRHLINWLILQFLVITTAYGGGLAMVLTLPRFTAPIETAADLAVSGLPWAAMGSAFVFGIKSSPDPILHTLTHNFYVGTEEELNMRTRTSDMAFVVERLQAGHFALPPYITESAMEYLRLMKDDIFWGHCVFMVRKGTPHMEKFNEVVNHLKEAGVTLHWEAQVVRQFLNERQQLAVIQSRTPLDLGPTQLHLEHLQGAYILLFIGLCISLITFIAEHIYSRLPTTWNKV